jgi:glyoxylase-like metal-dependent hydrolase (beta-lactamase superfamily II)
VRISKLVELEAALPLGGEGSMLPDAYPDAVKDVEGLAPAFASEDGHVLLSVHSFLIETARRRVVVDTCIGNGKTRSNPLYDGLHTSYLADLGTTAGWDRLSVDAVLTTHLHSDHVGWNTVLEGDRWVPTFPRARYCISREEYEHWSVHPHGTDADLLGADSVQPIVAAGLLELVEDRSDALGPEISLVPTPGHTPGHVSVVIESHGERAVVTGDVLHHACQVAHPEWCSTFDTDPVVAESTRREFLEEHANTSTLVLGTHFGGATAGRVIRRGSRYLFTA